ncbi:O-antigen polysaccharide polymerase Wzy [Virgibacillus dokdonensis]|uniref:O-antigen polysaccharide polymerase Wzy n=1 Tax=Virgibacillus dokdonensis TaxID=302167 RepID=A0ABU7VHM9_9BACI
MIKKFNRDKLFIVFFMGVSSISLIFINIILNLFELKFQNSYFSHLMLILAFVVLIFIWNHFFAKSYVDLINLFLVVQFIFFGGNSVLKVFNLESKDYFSGFTLTHNDYILTNIIIILSLLCFVLGASISEVTSRNKSKKYQKKDPNQKHQYTDEVINFSGVALLLIGLISFIIDFDFSWINSSYKNFGGTTLFKFLWTISLPTSGFVFATSNIKKNQIIGFSILFLVSFIYIVIGNRGYSISILLTAIWLYDNQIRKLPKRKLIFLSLLIVFIISVFYQMKSFTIQQKLNVIDSMQYINLENMFLSLFEESSITYRTLIYTVQSVPIDKGFEWGLSYFWALTTLVPNIFGTSAHPSVIFYENPSEWLAWTFSPEQASLGFGFGFSNLGEAYFNFGLVGIVFSNFAFGFLLETLNKNAKKLLNQRHKLILVAIVISNLFWGIRNPLSSIIRDAFYQYIIFVVILILIKMMFKKKMASFSNC